jgi:hypothetical protein
MPSSLFDQNVSGWSVDRNSSEFVNDFVTDYKTDYNNVGVNTNDPIYEVPAGTPDATISVGSGCNDFLPNTGSSVPVPTYVDMSSTADSPMYLYSPSLNKLWEFWKFSKVSAGHYQACWGGSATLSSFDGVFTGGFGEAATGISYLATAVTEADVQAGSINHAIAFILPQCNSYVYPADRTDCGTVPGQPGEGQWFRFPAGLAMPSGLSPFAQMVFKAIQTYGMVVTDHGGSVSIAAEQSSDWTAEGNSGTDPITSSWKGQTEYQVINSLPWSQLQVVDPPGH